MKIRNLNAHIARPTIPKDYGQLNKRDYSKIDIYVSGKYVGSTTWAASLGIARAAYADKYKVPLYLVTAHREVK